MRLAKNALFSAAFELTVYWKERKAVTPDLLNALQKSVENILEDKIK